MPRTAAHILSQALVPRHSAAGPPLYPIASEQELEEPMRTLHIIAALTMGTAIAMPAKANLNLAAHPEASNRVMALPGGFAAMPGDAATMSQSHGERHADINHRQGYYLFGRHFPARRRAPRPKQAPAQVEVRMAPLPVIAPPAGPPDARGPLRLSPARGIAAGAPAYSVGEALPSGLPHVTLDWRRFELPEPPPGRIYARVGRDVLLITSSGRVVESVLPPS
jgi:Ni/Co efflux regulator RcnB